MEKKQLSKGFEIKEVFNKIELYISEKQKIIYTVFGVILVLVLGYFGYKKLYMEPKERDAAEQFFGAQNRFDQGNYEQALNGGGKYIGLIEFIDSYSSTQNGNLAKYYAGLSYLYIGKFDEAIEYLKSYNGKDAFTKIQSIVCIGDAYMELGNAPEAISYYKKASKYTQNEITAPYALFRLGMAHIAEKQYQEALASFKEIKNAFPDATEAREIDKYIALAEASL